MRLLRRQLLLPGFLMVLTILCSSALSSQAQSRSRIYGNVQDGYSRAPLSGVAVTLFGIGAVPIRTTETDARGRYGFDDLSPGRYRVKAEKETYRPTYYGEELSALGVEVTVEGGREYDLSLFLVRSGTISGRILGPDRDPLPNAVVELLELRYGLQQQRFLGNLAGIPPVRSDTKGEYRITDIPPGNYYLRATYRTPNSQGPNPAQLSAVGGSTYYPGVTDAQQAVPISLAAQGTTTGNIDFPFVETPQYSLTGSILLPSELTVQGGNVPVFQFYLVRKDLGFAPIVETLRLIPDTDPAMERFALRNVMPGSYDLWVGVPLAAGRGNPIFTGHLSIEVIDRDLEKLVLRVDQGIRLPGRLVVNTVAESNSDFRRFQLILVSADGMPAAIAPTANFDATFIQADGSFELPYVPPGRYSLVVGAPQSTYLEGARLGLKDVLGQTFEIGAAATELQLQVSSEGGRLQAVVLTLEGSPAPRSQVVLVPSQQFRGDPSAYKFGMTDMQGTVLLSGIRPGTYTAFAFSKIANNAWTNYEFMSPYAASGVTVALAKGQLTQTNLRLIVPRQ